MHDFELYSGLKIFLQLLPGHLGWGVRVPCCCGEPQHLCATGHTD